MNKVKVFFIAAALVLVTAGVFAGKAKFVAFTLYADNGTNVYQIAGSTSTWVDLSSTTGSTQAKIIGSAGTQYGLYTSNPGTPTTKVFAVSGF